MQANRIPAIADINVHDSLDERTAAEHFGGLSVEAAVQLFHDASAIYIEDLMWMGPVAFEYYVQSLDAYLRSHHAAGDYEAVDWLCGVIEFRHRHDWASISRSHSLLRQLLIYVASHIDRFSDADAWTMSSETVNTDDADLKTRVENVLRLVS